MQTLGDNYLIAQQTARALLKHAAKLRTDSNYIVPSSSQYLCSTLLPPITFTLLRAAAAAKEDWFTPSVQIAALEHRAAFLVLDLGLKLASGEKDWSSYSWDCRRVADAHADVFIASAFQRAVSSLPFSAETAAITLLAGINALSRLVAGLAELLESGFVDPTQSRMLRAALDDAVTARMDVGTAVAMTDAFAFTRFDISGSILGRDGGDVYEEMWKEAQGTGGDEEYRMGALEIVNHHRQQRKGDDYSKPAAKL
ncbi:acyl-CoA dehydrogenase/oxidase C-terminal [Morchella snyderi]|nr:acyl-CoA dehydrogenase/oxidase C-terminal [Morchella snyderi]